MGHLEEATARWADPGTTRGAEQRAAIVTARLRKANVNQMAALLQKEKSGVGKMIWLKQITDELAKAMDGVAPCKDGCSHCCHMATFITPQEAAEMAKASGRPAHDPAGWAYLDGIESVREKYEGTPCPMLKDGRCSVYEARPFACRIHYSIDKDNLLCKIVPGEVIRAPSMNMDQFNLMFMLAHKNPLQIKFADIREFFP